MNGISIPGSPGTAMALAAGVSIWAYGKIIEVKIQKPSDDFSTIWLEIFICFAFIIFSFIGATIWIEKMHITKEKTMIENKIKLTELEIKLKNCEIQLEEIRNRC